MYTHYDTILYGSFLSILALNVATCAVKFYKQRKTVMLILMAICFTQMIQGASEFYGSNYEETDSNISYGWVLGGICERVSTISYTFLSITRLYQVRFQLKVRKGIWFILCAVISLLLLLPSMGISVYGNSTLAENYSDLFYAVIDVSGYFDILGTGFVVVVTLVFDITLVRTISGRIAAHLNDPAKHSSKNQQELGRSRMLLQTYSMVAYLVLMGINSTISLITWGIAVFPRDDEERSVAWVICYITWALHYSFEIYFQELVSTFLSNSLLFAQGVRGAKQKQSAAPTTMATKSATTDQAYPSVNYTHNASHSEASYTQNKVISDQG
jgi:hypothetical protein